MSLKTTFDDVMSMLAPELQYVNVIVFHVSSTQLNQRSFSVKIEWVPIYIHICAYVCIVMTVGCSALLIAKRWFGKLSIGKLRKFTYRSSVHHNDQVARLWNWNRDGSWMVWGNNYERSRFCGTVLVRREHGLRYYRNRVDCEAMCGSLCCWNDYEVYVCGTCKPLPFSCV